MAIRFYRHVVETAAPVAAQVVDIAAAQAVQVRAGKKLAVRSVA